MDIHRANTRGNMKFDWLDAHHSFSFGSYYNPDRMNFGKLVVLNDDIILWGGGFDFHPHENMEIVSIILDGKLEHKDNMWNTSVISQWEIQVMSAWTWIFHSEFNWDTEKSVNLLQIWIEPNILNVTPRYQQLELKKEKLINNFSEILWPHWKEWKDSVWIYQESYFYLWNFDKNYQTQFSLNNNANGLYIFIIEWEIQINWENLKERDWVELKNVTEEINFTFIEKTKVLLMEVPLI